MPLTTVEHPVLEPQTQAFIDALLTAGGPPIYTLSYEEARKVLAGAQAGPVARRSASVEDTAFPVGPTGSVGIRIVRPEAAEGILPVVMYFHGGGWVLGNKDTHDRLVRKIANGAHAAVVFVDYTPAPEAKYPTQNEQAYAAMKYVVEHAGELNVDASRLAIAGDSVGGNMAAVVSLMAKERKGPEIALQVLFYPVTDYLSENGSYEQFKDGPWLTTKAMKWFFDAQGLDGSNRDITAYPLRASVEQLEGLPDALVIVDENDILRDEGEAYARQLSQAGVRVTSTRYNGTIHDFVMLNALADTPAARGAIQQANAALRAAFR